MITYQQATGELHKEDGKLIAVGYSGHGAGVNNPDLENTNVGPIPRGLWRMKEFLAHHGDHGPAVIRLEPIGHDAHGRLGFLMHGDNSLLNKSASLGCIVAPRFARELAWAEGDRLVRVV